MLTRNDRPSRSGVGMHIVRGTVDRLRIALYSHDTMGLGHTRRNLLIARTLAAPPTNASVLMITGIREAGAFAAPTAVDFLTLPAFSKDCGGEYRSRSLALSAAALAQLRGETIKAALANFAPDVFIVDNVPKGALNELVPTLDYLARQGGTRCILGLRDVIDEPAVVQSQWLQRKNFEAVREHYDAVWIYGDPAVYDTATEYDFSSELLGKTRYTGYLDPQRPVRVPGPTSETKHLDPKGDPFVLCVLGGGQDGAGLARAFSKAKRPRNTRGLIITGPFMPDLERRWLSQRATAAAGLTVLGFVPDPMPYMMKAQSIVAMGGYNTVSEILSMRKRALLVPRCNPRKEQLIRAERLKAMGHIDFIRAEALTEAGISEWIGTPASDAGTKTAIDFKGLDRIPHYLADLTGFSIGRADPPPHIHVRESVSLVAV